MLELLQTVLPLIVALVIGSGALSVLAIIGKASETLVSRSARALQLISLLTALIGVAAWLAGERPESGLFWLYLFMPMAITLVAESLRSLAAQQILDANSLSGGEQVSELSQAQQAALVKSIVSREAAIVLVTSVVLAVLFLRALRLLNI